MVSNWIERKAEDIILTPIPWADREVIEVAEGIIGVDIDGLPHIDLNKMSTSHKILLAIFAVFGLPSELLDLVGLDPFRKDEADYHVDEEEHELETPSFDATSGRRTGRDIARTDGGEATGESDSDGGTRLGWFPGGMKGLAIVTALLGGGIGFITGGLAAGLGWIVMVGVLAVLGKFLSMKSFLAVSGGMVLLLGFAAISGGSGGGGAWGIGLLLDDAFGSATSGLGDDFEDIEFQTAKIGQSVGCLADPSRGAGCVREWQLEQTRRPGSEDVGETYELRVDGPRVYGGQNGVDMAYQTKDSPIPVYFLLRNVRHGIKGITAKDVQYRVSVRDEQIASSGTVLCSTAGKPGADEDGWMPLNKYGDADIADVDENDLLPGEAVEPINYRGDNRLTLEECGLLQPSAGSTVSFVLELKYDYSSQSTLQIPAMSREHRRSQGIDIRQERSETADTPVETFIQARSPVLFQDIGSEGRTPIPFSVRLGVDTDERNIEYRIDREAFELQDSSATTHLSDSCSGLANVGGEDTYVLSGSTRDTIETTQQNSWYDSQFGPSASCTFQLGEPIDISPTGETLTMSADVSYTVKQDEAREDFKVSNSLCTRYNCPMLVPLKLSDIDGQIATNLLNEELMPGAEGYWDKKYAKCGRPQDAERGCSIIESFSLEDRNNGPTTDLVVENGDIAVEIGSGVSGGNNLITCYAQDSAPTGVASIGDRELKNAWEDSNRAFNYTQDGWEITRLRDSNPRPSSGCTQSSQEGDGNGGEDVENSRDTLSADFDVSPDPQNWANSETEGVSCEGVRGRYDWNQECNVQVEFTADSAESLEVSGRDRYRLRAQFDVGRNSNTFYEACGAGSSCSMSREILVRSGGELSDSYSVSTELQYGSCERVKAGDGERCDWQTDDQENWQGSLN